MLSQMGKKRGFLRKSRWEEWEILWTSRMQLFFSLAIYLAISLARCLRLMAGWSCDEFLLTEATCKTPAVRKIDDFGGFSPGPASCACQSIQRRRKTYSSEYASRRC